MRSHIYKHSSCLSSNAVIKYMTRALQICVDSHHPILDVHFYHWPFSDKDLRIVSSYVRMDGGIVTGQSEFMLINNRQEHDLAARCVNSLRPSDAYMRQ